MSQVVTNDQVSKKNKNPMHFFFIYHKSKCSKQSQVSKFTGKNKILRLKQGGNKRATFERIFWVYKLKPSGKCTYNT
jgi:hypothetical protein